MRKEKKRKREKEKKRKRKRKRKREKEEEEEEEEEEEKKREGTKGISLCLSLESPPLLSFLVFQLCIDPVHGPGPQSADPGHQRPKVTRLLLRQKLQVCKLL